MAYAPPVNVRAEPPVSDAVRREIGSNIRTRREALGLSLSQLGKLLTNAQGNHLHGSQISKWELGKMLPSRFYWPQLAAALRVDETVIFGPLVEGGKATLETRITEIEDRVAALADLLGLTDAVEASMRARRRVTSPGADADVESESPADLALRLGDQDESEGRAASG